MDPIRKLRLELERGISRAMGKPYRGLGARSLLAVAVALTQYGSRSKARRKRGVKQKPSRTWALPGR